jgi:hypothetical protein
VERTILAAKTSDAYGVGDRRVMMRIGAIRTILIGTVVLVAPACDGIIEGHSGVVLWVPLDERDDAALILADVPRRGPGKSHRVEDGHPGVRFDPCKDRQWTAWTAGLALADHRKITLMVKADTASQATPVMLGPWEVDLTGAARRALRR